MEIHVFQKYCSLTVQQEIVSITAFHYIMNTSHKYLLKS